MWISDVLNSVAVSLWCQGSIAADSDGSIRSSFITPSQIPRGQFMLDPTAPVMVCSVICLRVCARGLVRLGSGVCDLGVGVVGRVCPAGGLTHILLLSLTI